MLDLGSASAAPLLNLVLPPAARDDAHPPAAVDLEALQQQAPGWAVELTQWEQAQPAPASPPAGGGSQGAAVAVVLREEAGVSAWLYRAARPFHPARLLERALAGTWPGVARSKGYVWLATRHDVIGLWQSAGGAWQCEPRYVLQFVSLLIVEAAGGGVAHA